MNCSRCGEADYLVSDEIPLKINFSLKEQEFIFLNYKSLCSLCIIQLHKKYFINKKFNPYKNNKC